MYGALIGDLVGFPCEKQHVDLTDRDLLLLPEEGAGKARAGETFSDKSVLTAGLEEGLLRFERKLPGILAGSRGPGMDPEEPAGSGAAGAGGPGPLGAEPGAVPDGGGAGPQGSRRVLERNAFEEAFCGEIAASLRSFGQDAPLAGYPMELSIWLFRDGAPCAEAAEAGAAARVSPVAWMFQEDLYMMRHLARLQARVTHRAAGSVKAADAAACAVFLAIHGCTKDYIASYLQRAFGYTFPEPEAMRAQVLQAQDLPALCVRAGVTAFLHGTDFEDVLRRAASFGGPCADIAAIAGAIAEAYFGIPERFLAACRDRLPDRIVRTADAFAARMDEKREARGKDPALQARWEGALTRASGQHPAAVQGNEPFEQAVEVLLAKKDRDSLAAVLGALQLRMRQKGRVFVPVVSVQRAEPGEGGGSGAAAKSLAGAGSGGAAANGDAAKSLDGAMGGDASKSLASAEVGPGKEAGKAGGMQYRLQAVRTRDGRLWQPAYTSRAQLDLANAVMAAGARRSAGDPGAAGPGRAVGDPGAAGPGPSIGDPGPAGTGGSAENPGPAALGGAGGGMVLSYSIEALLKRFLPEDGTRIEGIVFNPCGKPFFLPKKTIGLLLGRGVS